MSNEFLKRLEAAQTDEERSWMVTENVLKSLSEELEKALWAVAIPNWFDAEVLAALCPELADRAEEIYRQLQELSCVEIFPDRGHDVHSLTRNQLLDRLWQDDLGRFRELSGRAAVYFAKLDKPENKIESIYHLVIANEQSAQYILSGLASEWYRNRRKQDLESLIINLHQQIIKNRTNIAIKAETIYWEGKFKSKFYIEDENYKKAKELFEEALKFYCEIGDDNGEEKISQAIKELQQIRDSRNELLNQIRDSHNELLNQKTYTNMPPKKSNSKPKAKRKSNREGSSQRLLYLAIVYLLIFGVIAFASKFVENWWIIPIVIVGSIIALSVLLTFHQIQEQNISEEAFISLMFENLKRLTLIQTLTDSILNFFKSSRGTEDKQNKRRKEEDDKQNKRRKEDEE